jgi:hypothetical protein
MCAEEVPMNSGTNTHGRILPFLRPSIVLALAIAALISAVGMFVAGGIFYKTTPPLVIASVVVGGLSRSRLWSPTRQKIALFAAVLLSISLIAALASYFR